MNVTKNLHYINTPAGEQMRQEQMQRQQGQSVPSNKPIWQKYTGETAEGYDKKRVGTAKHEIEQKIIEGMLEDMHPGSWVLDCPIGTGRFLEFYKEKGFCVKGRDMSPDMLMKAAQKVDDIDFDPVKISLCKDDATKLSTISDACVDASLMIRLTRWLSTENCQKAFKQLQRVTRDRIIITARVANHAHARPIKLFLDVLEDDWELAADRKGYEDDYRILMFKRKK